MIKLREFDGEKFIDHMVSSISELKYTVFQLKKSYLSKQRNDRRYIEYCKDLDDIVEKETKKHLRNEYHCEKCVPEDHENEFCRCEDRNIKIAKQNREMLKDNKAEP